MPIMVITTRSSTSVKPCRRFIERAPNQTGERDLGEQGLAVYCSPLRQRRGAWVVGPRVPRALRADGEIRLMFREIMRRRNSTSDRAVTSHNYPGIPSHRKGGSALERASENVRRRRTRAIERRNIVHRQRIGPDSACRENHRFADFCCHGRHTFRQSEKITDRASVLVHVAMSAVSLTYTRLAIMAHMRGTFGMLCGKTRTDRKMRTGMA